MRILDQPQRYGKFRPCRRRWRKPDVEDLWDWLVDFWWNGRGVRGNAWFEVDSRTIKEDA